MLILDGVYRDSELAGEWTNMLQLEVAAVDV